MSGRYAADSPDSIAWRIERLARTASAPIADLKRYNEGVRRGIVVALVALAACESRYGAYLTLEGDIELDSVELYFGTASSGSTTQFASPRTGVQSGTIFDRQFSTFDRYDISPTRSTTFYIPPDEGNRDLGAYVVAVALREQQPVAIAEYFGFEVPSDEVHDYHLPLVEYNADTAERWGRDPGCIWWKRDRGDPVKQIVAVVQADDRDCDDTIRANDCNDLCSVGCCACTTPTTLCSSPCALGCMTNGTCTPETCLPVETCSSTCLPGSTLDARYQCAIERTTSQLTIELDTIQGQMCSHQYQFDLTADGSIPCTDPKIEYSDVTTVNGFTYTIAADPTRPGGCVIMSTQSTGVTFTTPHHMIVSFAAGSGVARESVIIAITPGNTLCVMMGYRVIANGSIYRC